MKGWIATSNRVGIFLAFLFVLCFAWYWIHPVHQELHIQFFELFFFGFEGMNVSSFFLGLIQSYIWGYVFSGLWYLADYCYCLCSSKG